MSILFYKVLHIFGLALSFTALGGMAGLSLSGADAEVQARARKPMGMLHGIGLLLLLVAGFGLIAKLKLPFAENMWISVKMILWILLGGLIALFRRAPHLAKPALFALPLIAGLAAVLAFYKPF